MAAEHATPEFVEYAKTQAIVVAAVVLLPASTLLNGYGVTSQPIRDPSTRFSMRQASPTASSGVYTISDFQYISKSAEPIDEVIPMPTANQLSDMNSLPYSAEEKKLHISVSIAVISIVILFALAVTGAIHWAILLPGFIAAAGVAISNGMQLNRIDELRTK